MRSLFILLVSCVALAATTPAEALELKQRVVRPPEMGYVTNFVIGLGKQSFCFMAPYQWSPSVDSSVRSVQLSSFGKGSIMIKPLTTAGTAEAPPSFDPPAEILARFDGATLLRQGECMTQAARAHYYDIRFTTQSGTAFLMRIVHVQVAGTRFEIALQTIPDSFEASLRDFQGLLTSFRPDKPAS